MKKMIMNFGKGDFTEGNMLCEKCGQETEYQFTDYHKHGEYERYACEACDVVYTRSRECDVSKEQIIEGIKSDIRYLMFPDYFDKLIRELEETE